MIRQTCIVHVLLGTKKTAGIVLTSSVPSFLQEVKSRN